MNETKSGLPIPQWEDIRVETIGIRRENTAKQNSDAYQAWLEREERNVLHDDVTY